MPQERINRRRFLVRGGFLFAGAVLINYLGNEASRHADLDDAGTREELSWTVGKRGRYGFFLNDRVYFRRIEQAGEYSGCFLLAFLRTFKRILVACRFKLDPAVVGEINFRPCVRVAFADGVEGDL